MELKASSQKRRLSSSDCTGDPEDKEISEGEDEDDDRNHKHRKKATHSQSLEGDSLDHLVTRPFNKRSKPFANGYSYREGDSQSGRTLNSNHSNASGRDFPLRFEKRRLNQPSFSRAPLDLNQRIRGNQSISVGGGPVINRGIDLWGPHDSRLGLVDVTSHMVQPGPIPGGPFAGRGLPDVSNPFGLIPGVPHGVLDALQTMSFQGGLSPAICPSMNLGIPLQRCRDFEERGFCLRGDMCPMEHGMNHIVVEDVQSLSQFNLPGSQLLGTSGQGALSVPGSLLNNKPFDAKTSNPVMARDGGAVDNPLVGGSDVYDPDQPLWTNDKPETSARILARNKSNFDETESLPDMDQQNVGPFEGFDDEHPFRSATTSGSQSSSIRGRIGSSKYRLGVKEKNSSVGTSSSYLTQDVKSEGALQAALPNVPNQGQWTSADQSNGDFVRNNQKPSHKALRTLFVKGIPPKENISETLLSHFQKFGQVIDIYIPLHSERAFVQFSKREEAEAALKAPDAVMGNRFIKLWWANRDNIPHETIRSNKNVPTTPTGSALTTGLANPIFPNKQKENPRPAGGKEGNSPGAVAQVQINEKAALMVANGLKAPPEQQKKLESLELLKEELRKKQEMLQQKRNEFKSKLDILQKQAAGTKDMTASDQVAKGLKDETSTDHTKAETSKPSPRTPKQEPLRPSIRPPVGTPFVVNRFKLDNRPTAFRIASPIPAGLANVAALEEHFSTFGDLSSAELEESVLQKANQSSEPSDVSARISFKTRCSAEKAFLHGKCWEGRNLQFKWLSPINCDKNGGSGNPSTSNAPSDDIDVSSSHSQKVDPLKSDEPENVTRENDEKYMEPNKDPENLTRENDEKYMEPNKDPKSILT